MLGDHVKQAGSLVSPSRLRFDFTHFQAVGAAEIALVERLVNEKIRENLPVFIKETTLEEGVREGAMAIFEEKYGETVRMVSIGDYSRELCGGAHAPMSGEIGLFKIVEEASVAAGLRRIEALTGEAALAYVQETEALFGDVLHALSAARRDVPAQVEKLKDQVREKDHEIRTLRRKLMGGSADRSEGSPDRPRDQVLVQRREGLVPSEARGLADALKRKLGSGIIVLGSIAEDKAVLVVGVTSDLTGRFSAAETDQALGPDRRRRGRRPAGFRPGRRSEDRGARRGAGARTGPHRNPGGLISPGGGRGEAPRNPPKGD